MYTGSPFVFGEDPILYEEEAGSFKLELALLSSDLLFMKNQMATFLPFYIVL